MTEERLAASRLRAASSFLDSIVENIPNMVFVKDAANHFTGIDVPQDDLIIVPGCGEVSIRVSRHTTNGRAMP